MTPLDDMLSTAKDLRKKLALAVRGRVGAPRHRDGCREEVHAGAPVQAAGRVHRLSFSKRLEE